MSTRGSLATLAALALLAAGCGSDAADAPEAGSDAAVAFAECMREHGVAAFPDPDPSGELTIDGVLNGSTLDPGSASWKAAMGACRDLQPAGFTGDDEVTPEQQEARLAFARCMRANGVEDFPDPAAGEPLVNTYEIPSSERPGGMEALNAAMQTCRDAANAAMGGQR